MRKKSKLHIEDLRYLQIRISGKSVYKSKAKAYFRRPKYPKLAY